MCLYTGWKSLVASIGRIAICRKRNRHMIVLVILNLEHHIHKRIKALHFFAGKIVFYKKGKLVNPFVLLPLIEEFLDPALFIRDFLVHNAPDLGGFIAIDIIGK